MKTHLPDQLRQLACAIFVAKGVPEHVAVVVATSLVDANLRGHDSHGIIRVPQYVEWLDLGWIDPHGKLEVIRDAGPILMVTGHYQFGQLIGREATALAITKARKEGVCVLSIRESSHLGRMGEFMEQAAEAGLVTFAWTNTHGGGVLQAAHGGYEPRLSANPLAAGAPLPDGSAVTMDFATSITAEGKVKVALARGEKLPDGYLVDGHGWPTSDPAAYYSEPKGAILPVAGHKGYALAVFADLLAGGLTGGLCSQANLDRVANGMLGLFLDPKAFAGTEAYNTQAEGLAAWLKSSKPREGFEEVLLPGEPETRTAAIRARNGIPVEDETWNKLRILARELALPAEMTL